MTHSTKRLGQVGEELAVRHLQSQGLVVLERNWRAALADVRGEVDVIAADGEAIVFCEVKARRGAVTDTAFAAVTFAKQRQLRRLAALYLAGRDARCDVRFDVVAVTWPPGGGAPTIDHLVGAF
ncbi:MAG TPA: YraN family protein [Egibacteraceae bacterium]|nr:YraN family protein [Egibacteraceae bacterium]